MIKTIVRGPAIIIIIQQTLGDSTSYDLWITAAKPGADGAIKVIREFARINRNMQK